MNNFNLINMLDENASKLSKQLLILKNQENKR